MRQQNATATHETFLMILLQTHELSYVQLSYHTGPFSFPAAAASIKSCTRTRCSIELPATRHA